MVISKRYIKYIYLFIAISLSANILYISPYESVFAKKSEENEDKKEKDKLVVEAHIN